MQPTRAQLQQAATDVRSAEASLSHLAATLHSTGIWSGADANRFQDEWSNLVRARLLSAAQILDSADFLNL